MLSWDLTRILLAVVAIGGLITASFWILRPFLLAVVWATMIVIASWPLFRAMEARLWGRRGLAVAVMTLIMLAALAVPLTLAVVAVIERSDEAIDWAKGVLARPLPSPPAWLDGLPLVGHKLTAEWLKLARGGSDALHARFDPYAKDVARWLLVQAGTLGGLFVQLLLTVGACSILYAQGETAAAGVLAFARRLAGPEGVRVALLSAGAIRAVALGIVVTALVQSVLAGIGLAVTGVPHAILLTSVMVMLGVAQIGPAPVLLGAIIWLFMNDQTFWGGVMIVWSLVAMSIDNVLRPLLIKRGADLPLLLIFAGVIGGLIAFGLIGLFVGPVVLAVTYTLLVAWVAHGETPRPEPAVGD
ncbi:MAG TPA: AI-2E family transporter YdiK [Candidatus Binatia bacterium]|nr:AI-2E family transporter YdiK [Candidatus Binatia bacterium]